MLRVNPLLQRLGQAMLCLTLGLLPLQAQLNPKWQSATGHDFLDLYQQNKSEKVKPEIVSLFDFSTSMNRMMFHAKYPNNYLLEEGTSTDPLSYYGVRVTLSGVAGARSVAVTFRQSYPDTEAADGPLFANYTIASVGLIRPDNTAVTEALVAKTVTNAQLPGSSAGAADVRNWVRAASHARMTFHYIGTGTPSMSDRTIDIPLHWCIIDPEQTLNDNDPTLKSLKLIDPLDLTHDPYEVDSTYLDEDSGSNYVCRLVGDATRVHLKETAGVWRYDYIDWFVRRGKEPDAPTKYVIRSANDSDWVVDSKYRPYGLKTTDGEFDIYSGLPRTSRFQAVKQACLMVWFRYQEDVFWTFRGLDTDSYNSFTSNNNATHPSSLTVPSNNTTHGANKEWISMVATAPNGNRHTGARRLAKLICYNGTPLNSSYSEVLAQYQADSPWSDLESDAKIRSCNKHFIMVMTDGNPSAEGSYAAESQANMPYWAGAKAGNTEIKKDTTKLNFGKSYWNLPTLAGVAAHAADPGKLTGVVVGNPLANHTGSTVADFVPFAINHRAQASPPNLDPAHPIQTLTVGISLGKEYNSSGQLVASSTVTPDFRLKAAACFGNPSKVTWPDPTTTIEFNPAPANGVHDPKEAFFFDASSPEKLVSSMDAAFQYMMAAPSSNVTAMPSIPYVGMGLGHQIYLGRFDPPEQGGPVWAGDLMMFPTKEVNNQTIIMDQLGNQITTDLKTATPGWRASDALRAKGWANRVVYTRLPATATNWNPSIQRVSDQDPHWSLIKSVVPGVDDAHKLSNLRWMLGADTTSDETPLPTRSGVDANQRTRGVIDIMGDVIDSAPTAVEYTLTKALVDALPSTLAAKATTDGSTRFRVIFVGTNQGYMHAFGEVSWEETLGTGNTATPITRAVIDELWAFIPTDVLPYITYYQTATNLHRAAVNGVPAIYHLDLPAAGNIKGNGKIDLTERALVMFGLGKGGRSYYGLDIRNPMEPKLGGTGNFTGWALVPDEAESYPTTRFEDDSTKASAIKNMGYSTNVPGVGRVVVGDPATTGTLRDVLFLGGGYSFYDIETNYPTKAANTKLGRSILALDVATGKVLKIWDMSADTSIGPISVGVVPFRYLAGTGMVQRLYFTDFFGGLWAINGTGLGTNVGTGQDYSKFRLDSSNLKDWASIPRPVYKQPSTNGVLSTLPAPFRVGTFYARTTAPKIVPGAVGIAMVSGDRNNPLDLGFATKNPFPYKTAPTQHRLTVVFDRQDSYLEGLDTPGSTSGGILDAKLTDMSSQTDPAADIINPGLPDKFYLTSGKYGYFINMPPKVTNTPKGIVPPTVLAGVAFWSYLDPKSVDPCTGGTGYTYTNRLCDVMRPTFPGNGKDASLSTAISGCQNGMVATWWGVASNIAAKSLVAVIQAGNVEGAIDTSTGLPVPTLTTKTFSGKFSSRFVQPRTWRTAH